MSKNIIGFMLIDTPHSALNNAGAVPGMMTENTIAIKALKRNGKTYPYISGQALRYWWRESLKEKHGWSLSPIERDKKIAFTKANPFKYEDDDVFGYMRAQKGKDGGTLTRLSPLKCSPLISVCEQKPVNDFGVMGRHEGDPVPYEHQFYSTIMKGIFSLNIDEVGVFSTINRTGYKNLSDSMLKEYEDSVTIDEKGAVLLSRDIRSNRIRQTISVLPYLNGGAKQTSHLTDVSPKFLVMAVIDCGNNIFMNITGEEKPYIDIGSLDEVIRDYKDNIISPVYIGKRKGFLDEINDALASYANSNSNIVCGSINSIVERFTNDIEKYID